MEWLIAMWLLWRFFRDVICTIVSICFGMQPGFRNPPAEEQQREEPEPEPEQPRKPRGRKVRHLTVVEPGDDRDTFTLDGYCEDDDLVYPG